MNQRAKITYIVIIAGELSINIVMVVVALIYTGNTCFDSIKFIIYMNCGMNIILAGVAASMWAIVMTIKIWGAWYRINFVIFIIIVLPVVFQADYSCFTGSWISLGLISYCILKTIGITIVAYIDSSIGIVKHIYINGRGIDGEYMDV